MLFGWNGLTPKIQEYGTNTVFPSIRQGGWITRQSKLHIRLHLKCCQSNIFSSCCIKLKLEML